MPAPRSISMLSMSCAVGLLACGAAGPSGVGTEGGSSTGAVEGADASAATASITSGGIDTGGVDASSGATTPADDDASSGDPTGAGDGLGPAMFDDDELDPPSRGGTITFTDIGAAGWYPSRRDPARGPCDAYETDGCCMATETVESDALTPWDRDLVLTLRGPMRVKQLAAYQPGESDDDAWTLVSGWDDRAPADATGLAFADDFVGEIGTECLLDVATDRPFACGEGSEPYCPSSDTPQHFGWAGAKLFVLLAAMPHEGDAPVGTPCSDDSSGNWWDAPWIGLSLGELARAGAFSDCQCYAKDPAQWWLADGCGQFNVFEVVNDNNEFRNLDVFSTNFFGYAGYVGEGPCGAACDVTRIGSDVDLIDKAMGTAAEHGAVASPGQGPGAAFRRPAAGYRYFVVLLDVASRSVQLAIVHPHAIPETIAPLLPGMPGSVSAETIAALRELRLPQ